MIDVDQLVSDVRRAARDCAIDVWDRCPNASSETDRVFIQSSAHFVAVNIGEKWDFQAFMEGSALFPVSPSQIDTMLRAWIIPKVFFGIVATNMYSGMVRDVALASFWGAFHEMALRWSAPPWASEMFSGGERA